MRCPSFNAGSVALLDHPRLVAQLCALERRTARGGRDSIDHPPNGHDDLANAACGVVQDLLVRQPAGEGGPVPIVHGAARFDWSPAQREDISTSSSGAPGGARGRAEAARTRGKETGDGGDDEGGGRPARGAAVLHEQYEKSGTYDGDDELRTAVTTALAQLEDYTTKLRAAEDSPEYTPAGVAARRRTLREPLVLAAERAEQRATALERHVAKSRTRRGRVRSPRPAMRSTRRS